MNEIRAVDGEDFNFRGVIVSQHYRVDDGSSPPGWHEAAVMKMSWPQANQLQADLRKLLIEAGATVRDAPE